MASKKRLDGWKIASRVTKRTARRHTLTFVGTKTVRIAPGVRATLSFEVRGVTLTRVASKRRKQ